MRWGILSVLIVLLLALPASALAAPENDKFASRQILGPGFPGGVPIEITGTNVEAGKEEGEFLPGFPAGHSVWFEWEATGDGWVSVGTCDSEFPTLIGVFTGADVKTLTPAAEGNGSEGPDCPFEGGRQYTFFATSGTKYVIAVDGNSFFPPEGTPPVTQGEFDLTIKETLVPPNDEFQNATKLTGSISEEPGGNRMFIANARGFNWTASTEHGEPEGATSGASVWYSFSAPEAATYSFGLPCCQTAFLLNRDLSVGDAVDELTLLAVASETGKLDLAAGETVRIRISGPIEEGSEEPKVANFDFNVSAVLAPKPSPPTPPVTPPPPPDTTAPETTIGKRYLAVGTAKFWFSSNEAGGFLCRLDKGAFKPCSSPRTFKHLKSGKHTFKVKAVDAAGNVDQTPALARFKSAARPARSR